MTGFGKCFGGKALYYPLGSRRGAEGGGTEVPDDTQMFGSAQWDQQGARGQAAQDQSDSQHEILFPAGLAAPHSDGRALDILHFQGHICVEFLCGGDSRVSAGAQAPLVSLPKL